MGACLRRISTREAELAAAVQETARTGKRVAVHATGEPGTLYAAQAGVASIDHAYQLSDETMRLMKEKQIFAVPTFAIAEYFVAACRHARAGRSANGNARTSRSGISQTACCRRAHGGWLGCGAFSARHTGARICVDGAIRDEAARGVAGGTAQRGEACLAGRTRLGRSRPDTLRTLLPFLAIR